MELLNEMEKSCSRHLRYMEYEKLRLIEMKRNRKVSFISTGENLQDDDVEVCCASILIFNNNETPQRTLFKIIFASDLSMKKASFFWKKCP